MACLQATAAAAAANSWTIPQSGRVDWFRDGSAWQKVTPGEPPSSVDWCRP